MITATNWSRELMDIDGNTILVIFHRARGYVNPVSESISVPSVIRAMAASLSERGIVPRGMILFGSPYLDAEFEVRPAFVMKTFSESSASIAAAAERFQQQK